MSPSFFPGPGWCSKNCSRADVSNPWTVSRPRPARRHTGGVFSHGSRGRLTEKDLGRFSGDTLLARVGRAVCRARTGIGSGRRRSRAISRRRPACCSGRRSRRPFPHRADRTNPEWPRATTTSHDGYAPLRRRAPTAERTGRLSRRPCRPPGTPLHDCAIVPAVEGDALGLRMSRAGGCPRGRAREGAIGVCRPSGVILGIDVLDGPRTDGVDLHDRFPLGGREVAHRPAAW
jgi:hypothetical protein